MKCTLTWTPEEGFVVDIASTTPELEVSLAGVGVPADGTQELEKGVALHRLDVLFKGEAVVEGAMGQIQDASVRYEDGHLVVEVRVEDVESGEILEECLRGSCAMPEGAPESGGPKAEVIDEDALDWEDDETIEQMVMSPPPAGTQPIGPALEVDTGAPEEKTPSAAPASTPESAPDELRTAGGGLGRLLQALLEDGEEEEAPNDPDDQTLGVRAQGLAFLEILMAQDALELEEGHELEELAVGAGSVLAADASPDTMAASLSNWLLDQDAVGDLFIGDEDLATLLAQW